MDKYMLALQVRSINAQIEAMGMVAANMIAEQNGNSFPYGEEEFAAVSVRNAITETDIRDMLNG